jgi:hypothetical protein
VTERVGRAGAEAGSGDVLRLRPNAFKAELADLDFDTLAEAA